MSKKRSDFEEEKKKVLLLNAEVLEELEEVKETGVATKKLITDVTANLTALQVDIRQRNMNDLQKLEECVALLGQAQNAVLSCEDEETSSESKVLVKKVTKLRVRMSDVIAEIGCIQEKIDTLSNRLLIMDEEIEDLINFGGVAEMKTIKEMHGMFSMFSSHMQKHVDERLRLIEINTKLRAEMDSLYDYLRRTAKLDDGKTSQRRVRILHRKFLKGRNESPQVDAKAAHESSALLRKHLVNLESQRYALVERKFMLMKQSQEFLERLLKIDEAILSSGGESDKNEQLTKLLNSNCEGNAWKKAGLQTKLKESQQQLEKIMQTSPIKIITTRTRLKNLQRQVDDLDAQRRRIGELEDENRKLWVINKELKDSELKLVLQLESQGLMVAEDKPLSMISKVGDNVSTSVETSGDSQPELEKLLEDKFQVQKLDTDVKDRIDGLEEDIDVQQTQDHYKEDYLKSNELSSNSSGTNFDVEELQDDDNCMEQREEERQNTKSKEVLENVMHQRKVSATIDESLQLVNNFDDQKDIHRSRLQIAEGDDYEDIIKLKDDLETSKAKVEAMTSKVADVQNRRDTKRMMYFSFLKEFESIAKDLCSVDMMKHDELRIENPVSFQVEKVATQGERKDVLCSGSTEIDVDSSSNIRKLSESVPTGDKISQVGWLSKLRKQLQKRRSKLIKLNMTMKKVKDQMKFKDDDLIHPNESIENPSEKKTALNTLIMQIMSSWLECISLLRCDPGQVKVMNKTKDQDLMLDRDNFYKKLESLCHQLLVFLKHLKDSQTDGNIAQGKVDLEGLKISSVSTEEDLAVSAEEVIGDSCGNKLKELTEQLVLIKLFLYDLNVGNSQNVTVETRVIVNGISWCMVNWRPTDLGTVDDFEYQAYKNKCFWVPQSILPEKFVVAEDKISPLCLYEAEGEMQSILNFKPSDQEAKVDQCNLSAIVRRYLTSDMNIENFVSVVNEAVKFSPADFEKITTTHRCK